MPAWATDELSQFEFMSGGFSNDNYSFYRNTTDKQQKYVLRVPKITQPFVDRSAELKTYQAMPEPVGVKVIAFEENSGCLITQWLNGQVLAETSIDSYTQRDLVDYVRSLHAALPQPSANTMWLHWCSYLAPVLERLFQKFRHISHWSLAITI